MTLLKMPEEELSFEIARLEMKPGDVLVVRPQRPVPAEAAMRIQSYVARALPNTKILVIDPGMELSVVTKAEGKRLAGG